MPVSHRMVEPCWSTESWPLPVPRIATSMTRREIFCTWTSRSSGARPPGHRVTGDRQQSTRGAGWEYVHVAVDDHSRVAFITLLPDETRWNACRALLQAVRYYRGPCVGVWGLKYKRTRPYTPRTNGKAERFIQTALRGWAYARSYMSSDERGEQLPTWLHQYNGYRPHASLDFQPLVSRLGCYVNNLVGLHI
ncbi:Integrase core domain-containing protein [Modicisalibacter ilicicola DSM 19980]|uniref:Integrase core domain-containing protein n=1 Tax=Modicisalibacter ilicicola DSM 19980 TaxID=1121942 RepID=A0A1M5ADN5_9GAMM|nr:Integrase core domain-containing protein [Halomonas ilicicola DSM 19980]